MIYHCSICYRDIKIESRGNPHPSPGDHNPAWHVSRAYNTGWTDVPKV